MTTTQTTEEKKEKVLYHLKGNIIDAVWEKSAKHQHSSQELITMPYWRTIHSIKAHITSKWTFKLYSYQYQDERKNLPKNPSNTLFGLWTLRALWSPHITLWPPGDCLPQNTIPTLLVEKQWEKFFCTIYLFCSLKSTNNIWSYSDCRLWKLIAKCTHRIDGCSVIIWASGTLAVALRKWANGWPYVWGKARLMVGASAGSTAVVASPNSTLTSVPCRMI